MKKLQTLIVVGLLAFLLASCTVALDCTTVLREYEVRESIRLYDQYGNYVRTEYQWVTVTEPETVCTGLRAHTRVNVTID